MELKGLTQDQNYLALPEVERSKVVEHFVSKDNNFKSLPEEEQIKVLNSLVKAKGKPKASKEEAKPVPAKEQADYPNTLIGGLKRLGHLISTADRSEVNVRTGEALKQVGYTVPVLGSALLGKDAVDELDKGNYGWATINAGLAALGIGEVKSAISGMRALMPKVAEKELAEGFKTTVSAEDIIKTHSNVNRMMKEDSSGSLIVDTQKFINEQMGIKPQRPTKIEKKDIAKRRKEVRDAFDNDKDYADYLRFNAEERQQMHENWLQENAAKKSEESPFLGQKSAQPKPSGKQPKGGEPLWEGVGIKKEAPKGQRGGIDPILMGRIAGASVGGISGAAIDPDHPLTGAILGAAAGFGGARVVEGIPKALESVKGAFKGLEDTRFRIDDLTNAHDYNIKKAARATMQATDSVRTLVKDAGRREAISHWIEGDRSIHLSPEELKAAQVVKQFFNEVNNAAQRAGVYDVGRENYVSHIWDFAGKGKSQVLTSLFGERGAGASTKFAKERSVPTLKEGIEKGLTPKTVDVANIMDIYSQSMFRAIENKKLVNTLKDTVIPTTGDRLLKPIKDKIPVGYKQVSGLPGFAVHPDVAGPLKVIFENYQPNVITRGILGLNMATKRLGVSYSLFHAKALTDAYIGAMGVSPKAYAELAKMPSGNSSMLKQLKEGGAGDMVDTALKGGLEISHPTADVDPQLLHMMLDDASKVVDSILPFKIGGKIANTFKAADKKLDTFMWERLHTGMKLEVFSKEYQNAILKNAEAHAKDATIPLLDKEKVAQDVASYVNDLFGGLNWNRIFNEAKTKVGRDVMMAVSSPSGRVGAQILMFAPDWTLSTTRAAYKALHPNNALLTKLHRRYVIRSALYYFTVAEALNQALSGHSVLENKDPTRIDFGDGRTMQFSKHAMEPVHWATDTSKQFYNKMGFVPKELMAQKEMQEPTVGKRIAHLGRGLLPITAQTSFDKEMSLKTLREAGLSFLGMPVYGKTAEEKEESKRKKEDLRRSRREARRRKREEEQ